MPGLNMGPTHFEDYNVCLVPDVSKPWPRPTLAPVGKGVAIICTFLGLQGKVVCSEEYTKLITNLGLERGQEKESAKHVSPTPVDCWMRQDVQMPLP